MDFRKLMVLLFLLTLFACKDDTVADGFDFGVLNSFWLYECNVSTDNTLWFTITEKTESRCPEGVFCIWQGEARVQISMERPRQDTLWMSTNDNLKDTLHGFEFELVDVMPYPVFSEPIKDSDVRVDLVIRKL